MARGREAAKQRILLNPGWGSGCSVAAYIVETRILSGCLLLFNCNGEIRDLAGGPLRGLSAAANNRSLKGGFSLACLLLFSGRGGVLHPRVGSLEGGFQQQRTRQITQLYITNYYYYHFYLAAVARSFTIIYLFPPNHHT